MAITKNDDTLMGNNSIKKRTTTKHPETTSIYQTFCQRYDKYVRYETCYNNACCHHSIYTDIKLDFEHYKYFGVVYINSFEANVQFLYPLKASQNQMENWFKMG